MINSLLMLGSSYNKDKKISYVFMISWIAYMILGHQFALGAVFPIVNAIAFLVVTICINLIKNRVANTILSVISILLWSVLIDMICYFMYPALTMGQNMFQYIFQGILFNYRYVFSNILAVACINGVIWLKNNIKSICKQA
mgnify:CR=1 FL=1